MEREYAAGFLKGWLLHADADPELKQAIETLVDSRAQGDEAKSVAHDNGILPIIGHRSDDKWIRRKSELEKMVYEDHLTDKEIGDHFGVVDHVVRVARKRLGIPSSMEIKRSLKWPAREQEIKNFVEKGWDDAKIGEYYNEHKATVGKARKKLGIPSAREMDPWPARAEEIKKMASGGLGLKDLSAHYKTDESVMWNVCERFNVFPEKRLSECVTHQPDMLIKKEHKKREYEKSQRAPAERDWSVQEGKIRNLIEQHGLNDTDLAERYGVSTDTICGVRKRLNIPSYKDTIKRLSSTNGQHPPMDFSQDNLTVRN